MSGNLKTVECGLRWHLRRVRNSLGTDGIARLSWSVSEGEKERIGSVSQASDITSCGYFYPPYLERNTLISYFLFIYVLIYLFRGHCLGQTLRQSSVSQG